MQGHLENIPIFASLQGACWVSFGIQDWKLCMDTFNRMQERGARKNSYTNCGRPPLIDKANEDWLVKRTKELWGSSGLRKRASECVTLPCQLHRKFGLKQKSCVQSVAPS